MSGKEETVQGIILSAMPIGEYDKRVVMLTKERGKIAAFAKGSRRPNSALLALTHPFSFGEFSLYRGRSSYTMLSGEIRDYFGALREDLDGVSYGFYFCEVADYFTRENEDATEVLKLLFQSLRCLERRVIPLPLARAAFELKMISLNGEAPQVFECVRCGAREDGMLFSGREGGFVCARCQRERGRPEDARPLSPTAAYAMQYVISTPPERLYTFTVTEDVLRELVPCVREYVALRTGHSFRSARFLES